MDVQLGILIANLLLVIGIFFELFYMNRGRRTEDLFTLMEFLHRPSFRKARMAVLADDWPIHFADYESDHRNIAWAVCSSFDFAGLMVYRGLVDTDIFYLYWTIPIVAITRKLEPFVAAQRFSRDTANTFEGRHYWPYYHILVDEANRRLPQVLAAITGDRGSLTGLLETMLTISRGGNFWNWFRRQARRDLMALWEKLWQSGRGPRRWLQVLLSG